MMYQKTESGMVFGEYPENRVFAIEDMQVNQLLGAGISVVEFIYAVSDKRIDFIEAKSSSPQESTDQERFEQYIDEIGKKFEHSFEILISTYLDRQDVKLPEKMKEMNFKETSFKFIFVIRGHQPEWLPPIMQALKKRMLSYQRIWKCEVIVWNDDFARQAGYIK